ncbi:MAG TPA: hypothetical protein VHZ78_10880 [Rhizomicrobium sp.]|nr:hypothetical protein [Rhizomicrobium sp.]
MTHSAIVTASFMAWLGAACGALPVAPLLDRVRPVIVPDHPISVHGCGFTYNAELRDTLIKPVILRMAENAAPFYDIDRPAIDQTDAYVQVVVDPDLRVDGGTPLDANLIEIDIDPCTQTVVKTEWISPFPQ